MLPLPPGPLSRGIISLSVLNSHLYPAGGPSAFNVWRPFLVFCGPASVSRQALTDWAGNLQGFPNWRHTLNCGHLLLYGTGAVERVRRRSLTARPDVHWQWFYGL